MTQQIKISFCGLLEIIDRFTGCSVAALSRVELPGTIDFHLLIRSTFLLQVRVVLVDDAYNYNISLRRVADVLAFKYEATKTEYMSLLINSLSHEMITPLTELLNLATLIKKGNISTGTNESNTMTSPGGQNLKRSLQPMITNSIIGSTTFINEHEPSKEAPTTQGSLSTPTSSRESILGSSITQIGNRLVLFVQSLLTYSQILNNKFELDAETDAKVYSLLHEVSGLYFDKCNQKKIEILIECNPELEIKVDRKRLICVLLALLDNAIKFTNQPKKNIILKAEISQSKFAVIFKVIDTGVGINTKDLEIMCHVLKKPFSTESTSSSAGLGIGLRTAQAILSQITSGIGEMQVITNLGTGTTVSFEIPIRKNQKYATDMDDIAELEINVGIGLPEYRKERGISKVDENSMHVFTGKEKSKEENQEGAEEEKSFIKLIAKNFVSLAGNKLCRLRVASRCRTQPPQVLGFERGMTKRLSKKEKTLFDVISKNGDKPRILIVDDEVFLLEYLRDLLEELDLDVYTANSPDSAIQLARMFVQLRIRINLVFMDYNMPGMNGPDCVKALKSPQFRPAFTLTEFTALTAQNDKLVKDSFREAGVNNFIFKPYTNQEIKRHLVEKSILTEDQLDE